MKRKSINPYKIIDGHPAPYETITLKWYRGASRYNNGATRFGRRYEFRWIISSLKQKLQSGKL